jgi:hypothetical protein
MDAEIERMMAAQAQSGAAIRPDHSVPDKYV